MSTKDYYDMFLKKPGEGRCEFCGKETSFIGFTNGYRKYCSRECLSKCPAAQKKREQTWLKKYGVNNPSKSKEVWKKIRKTWQERYGENHPTQTAEVQEKIKRTYLERYNVEHPMQTKETQEKVRITCQSKYGVDSPLKSKEVQEKIRQTCLEKYGVDNPSKSKEVQEKIRQTWLKKYGVDNPNKLEKVREKGRQTLLERYGVDNPMRCEEFKKKLKQTMLERYGVENPSQSEEIKEKIKKKYLDDFKPVLSRYLQELELELLDEQYQNAHYKHRWKCLKCGTEFIQIWNLIQQGFRCPKCSPIKPLSKPQEDLSSFLQSLGLTVVKNDRSLIKPYELDIVIPSHKLAIEFNGLYWHCEEQVGKDYHLHKTQLCESKEYRLIHIFEDEWVLKKDIVKSRLKHILGKTEDCVHIGARQCTVKEISTLEKNEFLEKYHIQGKDVSKVKLGAFYEDQLIAVMTFSHGSLAKGVKKQDPLVWELNRFCSKSDFVISGIASKLLEYFKKNYDWKEIFSYADRRWSDGDLYQKLGFELVSKTEPNYWYVDGFKRIHRFALRKRPKEPKDVPEWVLRSGEGYMRVWDCGSLKFVIENDSIIF